MRHRKLMLLGLFLGLCLVGVIASGDAAASRSGPGSQDDLVLRRLAGIAQVRPEDLTLVAHERERLVDGRQLVTVKALDTSSGESVVASFAGDPALPMTPVLDPVTARAAAGAAWRSRHGAMTPATVARMSAMGQDVRTDVAVWLRGEIVLPPQGSHRPTAVIEGTAGPWSRGSMHDLSGEAFRGPVPLGREPPVKQETAPLTPAEIATKVRQAPRIPDTRDDLVVLEAQKAARDAEVLKQMLAIRAGFQSRLWSLLPDVADRQPAQQDGIEGLLVVLEALSPEEVVALAHFPEVDALYLVPTHAGSSLSSAGPTQNADLIDGVGYDGAGVSVAVVEGAYAYPENPYLTLAAVFEPNRFALIADQRHATGVTGIIGSTHPTYRGLAKGATLYAANGDYSDFSLMLAALRWGQQRASVLNNSWYWDTINSPTFWAADRELDTYVRYNRDFVAVAAGNFGDPACYTNVYSTTYVVSPAKGYNVMSVGNTRDQNTLAWDDDVMSLCSSYGDPMGETSSPTHAKPEVAAVGSTIESTVISSTVAGAIGSIGSGTSFASPMVAALAADLIQAAPQLATRPEAVKAIIMATALRNLEGDLRLSDVDGAGGIMPTAALATVERGHWASTEITSSASFPITFTTYAHAGERVRFVVTWLANPTATWTTAPPDLDLYVTREGDTYVASSFSVHNTFEIVDFAAVASETYTFTVRLAGTWSYGSSYLGAGWWRGTYRIPPDTGFYDPPPTPLGTHLSIHPEDWPAVANWRGIGIRPVGADLDLVLSSASWFDDPAARSVLAVSAYPGTAVDYIAVNGHHPADSPEHYRVKAAYGSGSTYLGWSSGITEVIGAPGTYGPYGLGPAETVKALDIRFPANRPQVVQIVPQDAGTDLGMELFASAYGQPASWTLGRGDGVARADRYGVGTQRETLVYRYDGSVEDIHGLLVYNNTAVEARFSLIVADAITLWLPLVQRQGE